MSIITLTGLAVSESSYRRARQIVEDRPQSERKSASDVLASLRQMMPGWTITTSASEWSEGGRNVEISERTLQRMAEDPDAMVRYKALLLDLEDFAPELEQWKQENPGMSLELGLIADENGMRGMAIVRTLLGGETRTTFDLPSDRLTWAELFRQKVDALAASAEPPATEETKSWQDAFCNL
ncbi:MAG: hypothetical protein FWF79_06545 [Defluviitaleaceae bacterium]|nr:hypothetical protein [Defluviitaleaceae bacterium]